MTLNQWLRRKILVPLFKLLSEGLAPSRLALCVAVGVVIGTIPVLGVSTVLCTLVALLFRLNLPAIQLAQWAMAPIQLLLIIPFVRLGEWLLRAPPQPLSLKAGAALMQQGVGAAVVALWDAIVHASLAWALVAPVVILLLNKILTPIFKRAARRTQRP
jgi:uncharacterized protein (DUF2062 family)